MVRKGSGARTWKSGFTFPPEMIWNATSPVRPARTPSGVVGASPSGKAADFDSAIRRFESSRPSQTFLSDQIFRTPRAKARVCGAFARARLRTRLFGARFTRLWGKISPRSGGAIFRYPQSGLARGPDRFALAQDRFACRRVTAPMTAVSTSDAETRATNPDASLRFCKSAWKHSSGIARPACWRASR